MSTAIASYKQTLEWVLETSQRKLGVPIHNIFVQTRDGRRGTAGPLASFVTAGRARALDLYLLALLRATREPYNVALPAGVWARSLGVGSSRTAAASISKQWRWLAERRLIGRRGRHGSSADIVIL